MALKPIVTQVSDSFTRPANTTAYASGDLVADNTTAGSVTPLSWAITVSSGRGLKIRAVKLETDNTTATNADFRLHLYENSPTPTNGDNGAWLTTESNHIGYCDIGTLLAFSDAIANNDSYDDASAIIWRPSSATTLYGFLEARGAYTPASGEIYTVTLTIEHY